MDVELFKVEIVVVEEIKEMIVEIIIEKFEDEKLVFIELLVKDVVDELNVENVLEGNGVVEKLIEEDEILLF